MTTLTGYARVTNFPYDMGTYTERVSLARSPQPWPRKRMCSCS